MMTVAIPQNLHDFLYWVKERTEAFWSRVPGAAISCEDWITGAKWIGLKDHEIDAIEAKYAIRFTPEHRLFLSILHTIDRKEKIEYTETFDEDAPVLIEERPFFYNWLTDEEAIRESMHWPFRTIWEDVTGPNRVWLRSWGARPADEAEQRRIFTEWYHKAPALLPIKGHRFIISDVNLNTRPILSVWGSDIIVYGWDLRGYLLRELEEHLDIHIQKFDEGDQDWYTELQEEAREALEADHNRGAEEDIPYWKEMILIWSSGWSSFCLDTYSSPEVQPIVKTYSPEGDNDAQKTFSSF